MLEHVLPNFLNFMFIVVNCLSQNGIRIVSLVMIREINHVFKTINVTKISAGISVVKTHQKSR